MKAINTVVSTVLAQFAIIGSNADEIIASANTHIETLTNSLNNLKEFCSYISELSARQEEICSDNNGKEEVLLSKKKQLAVYTQALDVSDEEDSDTIEAVKKTVTRLSSDVEKLEAAMEAANSEYEEIDEFFKGFKPAEQEQPTDTEKEEAIEPQHKKAEPQKSEESFVVQVKALKNNHNENDPFMKIMGKFVNGDIVEFTSGIAFSPDKSLKDTAFYKQIKIEDTFLVDLDKDCHCIYGKYYWDYINPELNPSYAIFVAGSKTIIESADLSELTEKFNKKVC